MLTILLVVAPADDQYAAVVRVLAEAAPEAVYVYSHVSTAVTAALVAPSTAAVARETRLDEAAAAIAFVTALTSAAVGEASVGVVASAEVVRAIVTHALGAPVVPERLRFDAGTVAEVEARADAPWTVNRLNDGCHLAP